MGNTLITISRQHGSGGTKVAQILAEKLGIWYYNREILYIAADKIGYDSLDEKSMDEINYKKASKYMEGLSIMTGSRNHIPVYNWNPIPNEFDVCILILLKLHNRLHNNYFPSMQ